MERTHNLTRLLRQLADVEPGIEDHLDAATTLTPYGVDVRYPGLPRPTGNDARDALQFAEAIVKDTRERIGRS